MRNTLYLIFPKYRRLNDCFSTLTEKRSAKSAVIRKVIRNLKALSLNGFIYICGFCGWSKKLYTRARRARVRNCPTYPHYPQTMEKPLKERELSMRKALRNGADFADELSIIAKNQALNLRYFENVK